MYTQIKSTVPTHEPKMFVRILRYSWKLKHSNTKKHTHNNTFCTNVSLQYVFHTKIA